MTARMRQGIRSDLRRILIGRDFETAEDLRAAIENIELEIASPKDDKAITKEDLKEIIQSLKILVLTISQTQYQTLTP